MSLVMGGKDIPTLHPPSCSPEVLTQEEKRKARLSTGVATVPAVRYRQCHVLPSVPRAAAADASVRDEVLSSLWNVSASESESTNA